MSVARAGDDSGDAGILCFEFPNSPGGDSESLDEVDWEPFFSTFDDRGLAFVYQEKTSDGEVSTFTRFVRRDGDD